MTGRAQDTNSWLEAVACGKRNALSLLILAVGGLDLLVHGAVETNSISAGTTASSNQFTRVRQIKALSSEQASKGSPVQLPTVVTYYDPGWNMLMVADRSAGIYVDPAESNLNLAPGQHVLVQGVTGVGKFAPIIRQAHLTSLGRTNLPPVHTLSEMDVVTGRLDNEWVEVEGVVRSVSHLDRHATFVLATAFGVLRATTPIFWEPEVTSQFIDARVRLQAVCGSDANGKRQFAGVRLWVPNMEYVRVIEPALSDPFSLPLQSVASLRQYEGSLRTALRVRISGVVTLVDGDRSFVVQGGPEGVRVRARERVRLKVGAGVDVVGYPAMEGASLALQDAVVRPVATALEPTPTLVHATELSQDSFDGVLVQVRGRLLDKAIRNRSKILWLEADQKYFEAKLERGDLDLDNLRLGSQLGVTGVCDLRSNDRGESASFVLELRGASDVQVLAAASWWTPERASAVMAVASLSLLVTMSWVHLLRRRVAQQTAQVRKSLEQEAAAERRYHTLFENAHDFIFTCTAEGRFTSFNRAGLRMIELTETEVQTRTLFSLLRSEDSTSLRQAMATAAAGQSHRCEVELETTSGASKTVDLTLSFLARENGAVEAQGIGRDVTERKRTEVEMRRARDLALENARLKADFLANMSHEIRTPMNGVIGMTNLLLGTALAPQQRDFAETIRTSAEALLAVINDILDFSKIESGKLAFEQIDFDLRQTVEAVLEVLAPRADAKGLELACRLDEGTPLALRGDPLRMRQVLTNLVGNAVKFTERGEVIVGSEVLSQTAHQVTLRFTVRDTGIGISPEAQGRLFQPFMQAENSSSRRFGGTGLGLAISRQLVELMGGQIGLESVPEEGSTFWFSLTLEKQAQPAPKLENPLWIGLPVLVVDDNATSRGILERQLGGWGLRVLSVPDAAQGLSCLREAVVAGRPYALVLVDACMPGIDGLELARQIKAEASLAKTPMILLSSLAQPLPENELKQAGLAAAVPKPIKQARLWACVETVLALPGAPGQESQSAQRVWTVSSTNQVAVRPMRILLAEDNPINQKVALGQLQRLGYQAEVAGNGQAVLQALERAAYDVILMDCQMPELDGYETTARIRERERQGSAVAVRIIAMTAHAMKGDREKCLAAGMDDYLTKPIRTEELGQMLEQVAASLPAASAPAAQAEPQADEEGLGSAIVDRSLIQAPESPVETEWLLEAVGGIEAEARALAEFYLEQATEMLQRLEEAVDRFGVKEIEHLAHKLAGASGSCGITIMVGPLRELENTARAGTLHPDQANQLLADITRRYARVREFLATWCSEPTEACPQESLVV